jgi:hypothetical protein
MTKVQRGTYSSCHDDDNEITEESIKSKYVECTICIGNFEEKQKVMRLQGCDHVFHESCLEGWLKLKARCPNCNKELNDREE